MTDFQQWSTGVHPVVRLEDDWNQLLDHGLEKPYSYLIRVNGSYYEAINGSTGVIAYGGEDNAGSVDGTLAKDVFQAAITATGTAGGGVVFVKNGAYTITNSIVQVSNVDVVGESRDGVVLTNTHAVQGIFRKVGATLSNLGLNNMSLKTNTGSVGLWHSSGTTDLRFINCRFEATTAIAGFIVFLDTTSGDNDNFRMRGCIFEGDSGGNDMFGCGEINNAVVDGNQFLNGDGQGMGVAYTDYARFTNNYFYKVGNAIGLESGCYGNLIQGNMVIWGNGIGLSSGTTHPSYWNTVDNNKILYCTNGVYSARSYCDHITNNTIAFTQTQGIYGSFDRGTISGNTLKNNNWSNSNVNINGVNYNDGGIIVLNDATIPVTNNTRVFGNTLYEDRTNYTHLSGDTRQGNTGGIYIDTKCERAFVQGNAWDGTYAVVVDEGAYTTFDGQATASTSVDLSGGAETLFVFRAPRQMWMTRATFTYTEASSADVDWGALELGYARDGAADSTYYLDVVPEASKNIWYTKTYDAQDFDDNLITTGDTITFTNAGGKTGGGEIRLQIDFVVGY